MANEKLQAGRALVIIPSDTIDIPYPTVTIDGLADAGSNATTLVDAAATFITSGVKVGDIIYNDSASTVSEVTGINSETTLKISGSPFTNGDQYRIFQGGNNSGCVLYVGIGGDLDVETVGGDVVTFSSFGTGQFLPVQVKKVLTSTVATNILALW